MASLMHLLFETMPLSGARHAVASLWPPFEEAPIELLRDHVTALSPAELGQLKVTSPGLSDAERKLSHRERSIWSFDASGDFAVASNLECRVEQEGFRNCRVLDQVEFGGDYGKGFEKAVEITLPIHGRRYLRLDDTSLFASFFVRNGTAEPGDKSWWPTNARHDYGYVHAFLFEVDHLTGDVKAADSATDPELQKVEGQLRKLRPETPLKADDTVATLFADDAWQVVVTWLWRRCWPAPSRQPCPLATRRP